MAATGAPLACTRWPRQPRAAFAGACAVALLLMAPALLVAPAPTGRAASERPRKGARPGQTDSLARARAAAAVAAAARLAAAATAASYGGAPGARSPIESVPSLTFVNATPGLAGASSLVCEDTVHDSSAGALGRACLIRSLYYDAASEAFAFLSAEAHELPEMAGPQETNPEHRVPMRVVRELGGAPTPWAVPPPTARGGGGGGGGEAAAAAGTHVYAVGPWHPNFCHAMNDWFLPLYALISRAQGSARVDPSRVVLLLLRPAEFRQSTDAAFEALSAVLSTRPRVPLRALHAAATRARAPLSLPPVVVGGSGWTLHFNEAYNWHPARWQRHPARGGAELSANALRWAAAVRRAYAAPGGALLPASAPPAPPSSGWILLANRPAHRRVINDRELLAAMRAAHGARVPARVYDFGQPLASTVRLLSETAALVAPHGAGLTNVLWMRPGALVLELLPFMCGRLGAFYGAMANAALLRHRTWLPPTGGLTDGLAGFEANAAFRRREHDEEPCTLAMTRRSFNVDVPDVLRILGEELIDAEDWREAARKAAARRLDRRRVPPEAEWLRAGLGPLPGGAA